MSEYRLVMKGVVKTFPGVKALDHAQLELRPGKVMALMGENGAGKSTLMSVLFGLYQAEEGVIKKDGVEVKINNPNDANALGIGMVHQHFKLVECFTVLDNIILGVEPTKFGFLQKKEARQKVLALSERYGLHVDPDAKVEDITVGMQQRTEILKMLYRDDYDEPTLPYLRAEELGGNPFDWCYQRDLSTPLGGRVYSVGETPYAGMIDGWEQLSTEVDFYAPRISVLAKPLTHELRDYFMGSGAQTLSIDGFDEAYYAEFIKPNTRLPNEPDEVHQFLILRRGGEMLYFRTEAPDSLREHLDEFADIFDQYSELA